MKRGRLHRHGITLLLALVIPLGAGIGLARATVTDSTGSLADSVVVYKTKRELHLLKDTDTLRTYIIALGKNPVGAKDRQGDAKTPEGRYVIDWHNPNSKYYLSLHISYPGPADRQRAARLGMDPGGDIMIHGLAPKYARVGRKHRLYDWTNGCIAVTNEEMDEIWGMVKDGTPIIIYP